METKVKIITFPNRRRNLNIKTDDERLADDVYAAWRKLWRTIDKAQRAGLRVRSEFGQQDFPRVTREFC